MIQVLTVKVIHLEAITGKSANWNSWKILAGA